MATNSLKKSRKTAPPGAIVDEKWWNAFSERVNHLRTSRSTFAIIRAADTLLAYQNLAANYRTSLPLKVLAITGSNGKTSTKDFSASVLGAKIPGHENAGKFQQPCRPASDDSGRYFAEMKSPFGRSE